jgi:Holliday junction resolvasome RuvABC endonuclease subunit
MRILALDTATKTGWCYGPSYTLHPKTLRQISAQAPEDSGVFNVRASETDSDGELYATFRFWLTRMVKKYNPSIVVYEGAHHRGGPPTEKAMAWITRIKEVCALNRIVQCYSVHSSTLKKWATGTGRAEKPDMLAAANRRWPGIDFIDDNEVDAVWLWHYATSHSIQCKGKT